MGICEEFKEAVWIHRRELGCPFFKVGSYLWDAVLPVNGQIALGGEQLTWQERAASSDGAQFLQEMNPSSEVSPF